MAVLRDKEEEKGQGTSQALGQPVAGQMQQQEPTEAQPAQPSGPATIGGSSATQISAPVKAMPKQQKAGTGTFANLKSYLQAAQGGGQQKVAQAATQQVQRLGTSAQKGVQQAQESFAGQLGAGSGAIFKGAQPGQYLEAGDVQEKAKEKTAQLLGAAKATTYQAPIQAAPQTQAAGEAPTTTQTSVAQPQQYFAPEDLQSFANIINAQYQGPQSLQQAGLYEQAARKARAAQEAGELTQTTGGREQLLRNIFGSTRDYSRGASKLDALLLNASEQGVRQLQQQAQPALQAQQALQAAQNLSANEAASRAAAIEQIRSGARQQFAETRTAEEKAVEDRLAQVAQNWSQLPEYFKNLLKTRKEGQALSTEEAGILGLRSGQSLYGLDESAIQQTAMERARNISKDELSRQLALAQLAELDKSKSLQKDLTFTDLEKAGTQNILQSMDLAGVRRNLAEREAEAIKKISGSKVPLSAELVNEWGNKYGYDAKDFQNLYNLMQSKAGFSAMGSPTEPLVESGESILKSIAEGKAYTPSEVQNDPGVVAKLMDFFQQNTNKQVPKILRRSMSERFYQPTQRKLTQAGFGDVAKIAEDEQTSTRAAALRQILGNVYKK